MDELQKDVLVALVSLCSALIVQNAITKRKNMKFLKDKGWDLLLDLVKSVTSLIDRIQEAHNQSLRTRLYSDVSIEDIKLCRESMKNAEPYIHIIGHRDISIPFLNLLDLLVDLFEHENIPEYQMLSRMEINKIPEPASKLIRAISSFMNYG